MRPCHHFAREDWNGQASLWLWLHFKWLNLGLWVLFSLIGKLVETMHFDGRWFTLQLGGWMSAPNWIDGRLLVPLGITPTHYPAVDFFPIFPWLGVVLLGVFLGNLLYAGNVRRFPLPSWGHRFPFSGLEFLGRHSLLIYMIHQPILLAILWALGVVRL